MATNLDAPEGTYSSRPFVSKDGVDENGIRAEVRVLNGYGAIENIVKSKRGNSNNVSFAVRNNEYLVSGWSRDVDVMKLIEEAQENNAPIYFRIETRRKDEVDRTLPIEEISKGMENAKKNTIKSIAAVRMNESDEWTISSDAVTRLDEDPKRSTGLYSAYDSNPEDLKPAPASAPRSFNGREPAPFIARFDTGEVNPGSSALQAIFGFFQWILEEERKGTFEIEKERRKEVARDLLLVANSLQLAIYGKIEKELKGGPDLTTGSHIKARALIFESIRSFYPLTTEILNDEISYKKWLKSVRSVSLSVWEWLIQESEEFM